MSIKLRLAALIAALLLTPALALAGEEFDGNVVAGDTVAVAAPYGGTVASISLTEGALIAVGDPVATMKKMTILLALCLALGAVFPGFALAETTFDGTVVSGESVSVTAPFGGTVDSFTPAVGDRISEGDVIASVKTTKVYASIAGTVTGVFGQPGDTISDVVSRVGAVLYLEPLNRYTITADIQHAYNDSDNKYINIGETLYIRSYYTSNGNTAVGKVVAVDGVNYTVETTEGDLLMQETVSLYRDADYTNTSRVGRGTVSRTAEVAVGADSETTTGSSAATGSTQSILTLHGGARAG